MSAQKRKVTNWRDYDESLRRRGSLTVWFSDEAVEAWEAERRTSRGGQPEYSDLAILTALTFKAVFRLAYRRPQAQGSLRPERRGHDQGHSAEPQLIFSEQSRVLPMRLLTGPDRPGSASEGRHSREVRPWPETPRTGDG